MPAAWYPSSQVRRAQINECLNLWICSVPLPDLQTESQYENMLLNILNVKSCFKCFKIYSRSCLLEPPLPPGVCTVAEGMAPARAASALLLVKSTTILYLPSRVPMSCCCVQPTIPPAAGKVGRSHCCAVTPLNKAHPELLVGNEYFSAERVL